METGAVGHKPASTSAAGRMAATAGAEPRGSLVSLGLFAGGAGGVGRSARPHAHTAPHRQPAASAALRLLQQDEALCSVRVRQQGQRPGSRQPPEKVSCAVAGVFLSAPWQPQGDAGSPWIGIANAASHASAFHARGIIRRTESATGRVNKESTVSRAYIGRTCRATAGCSFSPFAPFFPGHFVASQRLPGNGAPLRSVGNRPLASRRTSGGAAFQPRSPVRR